MMELSEILSYCSTEGKSFSGNHDLPDVFVSHSATPLSRLQILSVSGVEISRCFQVEEWLYMKGDLSGWESMANYLYMFI